MSEPTQNAGDPDPTPSDSFHANVPELSGTFVGKYQIKRLIASGGMGVVYEAVQEQPRRSVALKLMRIGLGSRAAMHRFQTEAQTLARLHHPNIAQVYEAGMHVAGGLSVPYFAMEYIGGARPIDAYANAKQLGTAERLTLFAQVCDAIEHGHSRGIIHRDLKPENVLVGADGMLKVIDFGVARAIDSDLASPTLQTMAGAVIGTPLYCSPEQFDGDSSALDERTDVYSLGMLLYELLLGRLPYTFTSQALPEVSRVVCSAEPLRPSKVNRALGRDVDAVILTALQKDRTRRYPTAAALATDVRCLISGEPVSRIATHPTLMAISQLRSSIARHPAATALIVMIVTWGLAWKALLPLVYRTPADAWILSRIVSIVPYRDPAEPFQSIKLITINDETDLSAISARERLSGLSAKNLFSQRRMFGRLLERLAGSSVRLVVFDMYFRTPDPEFDSDFLRGIRKFKSGGGQVVIGTRDWRIGADDSTLLVPAIKSEVTVGCLGASATGRAPWALELFVEHLDADAIPGLALAAFGAFRNPGAAMSLSPRDARESVEVRYHNPTTQTVLPVVAGKTDVIELSTLRAERTASVTAGLQKGDVIGRFVVPIPSNKALQQSTVEIGQVLAASTPQEMNQLIDRPVVVVASNRAGVDGPHDYVDGRKIRGFYAQAAGLDMLLRGDSMREPRRVHEWALMWLGAVAGVGIAVVRGISRQLAILAALALLAPAAVFVAYRMSWLVDPLIAGVPLLLAFALMHVFRQPARMRR